ncbi:retrovirus-related Pol polyprotein from transposon 412 [Trichonephila clavipes]|nr:retrovirus-related Pol polyprotein from transposon 412 [Trichonephila clavipes]
MFFQGEEHHKLHSDQGRNFDSAVYKGLCEMLVIDKTRTTALHPQSDGMVESFDGSILNSLSLLVSSNQQDWDKKLPFFLFAYRSAVYETTVYSHLRCSLDVIFVCLQIFISAGHQMHPQRLRSISRNSRHGWRKCFIWLGKESAWLPRLREDEDPIRLKSNQTRLPRSRLSVDI